jgi:hypothetical protein
MAKQARGKGLTRILRQISNIQKKGNTPATGAAPPAPPPADPADPAAGSAPPAPPAPPPIHPIPAASKRPNPLPPPPIPPIPPIPAASKYPNPLPPPPPLPLPPPIPLNTSIKKIDELLELSKSTNNNIRDNARKQLNIISTSLGFGITPPIPPAGSGPAADPADPADPAPPPAGPATGAAPAAPADPATGAAGYALAPPATGAAGYALAPPATGAAASGRVRPASRRYYNNNAVSPDPAAPTAASGLVNPATVPGAGAAADPSRIIRRRVPNPPPSPSSSSPSSSTPSSPTPAAASIAELKEYKESCPTPVRDNIQKIINKLENNTNFDDVNDLIIEFKTCTKDYNLNTLLVTLNYEDSYSELIEKLISRISNNVSDKKDIVTITNEFIKIII